MYWKLFPDGQFTGDVKPITHLHPMPNLRMDGAIPPLAHMPSWCVQRQVLGMMFLIKVARGRVKNTERTVSFFGYM